MGPLYMADMPSSLQHTHLAGHQAPSDLTNAAVSTGCCRARVLSGGGMTRLNKEPEVSAAVCGLSLPTNQSVPTTLEQMDTRQQNKKNKMTAARKAGHRTGGPPTFFGRLQHCGKGASTTEHTRPVSRSARAEPSLVRPPRPDCKPHRTHACPRLPSKARRRCPRPRSRALRQRIRCCECAPRTPGDFGKTYHGPQLTFFQSGAFKKDKIGLSPPLAVSQDPRGTGGADPSAYSWWVAVLCRS